MVDGQPITDQQSKVFSNQIPLESIASMEVIAGAPPAEFGEKTSVVINATTRSGQGLTTPSGSVTFATRRNGTEVGVSVHDTGPGIAPEHVDRIFDRFYRIDQSRSRELGGTGLGLAIARLFAELQGGRIEVESKLGEGSTFTVWLPSPP